MSKVMELQQLTKRYGDFTAVDQVSFSVEAEKIYGLLGRNSAGKTTIMQMITALIFPTSGELKVFGESPYENNRVLSQLCFIKESQKYPDTFRIVDVLTVAATVFPNWDNELAYSLVKEFELPLKRRMKKLSRGMHSAVGIIIGLASRAPLTIFDEPYLGLDPVARNLFYDRLIEDYANHPRTIILSTHLIDEVSRILEHVFVIDQGKLILNEEADTLRERAFTVIGPEDKVADFIKEKEVTERKAFGSFLSATVMEQLNSDERKKAQELGLDIAPISMQQLIINLTKTTREVGEVK